MTRLRRHRPGVVLTRLNTALLILVVATASAVAGLWWRARPSAAPPPPPGPQWQWIVVHHSAGPEGNAAVFDQWHRQRGWDELGYHFVIGNGHGSGDGQVEVGPRWAQQRAGAHCHTPSDRFNRHGIGVCLVGDFSKAGAHPTPAQRAALVDLCVARCRDQSIPPDHILGHRDAQTTEGRSTTECPGSLDIAGLRKEVAARLAAR